MLLALLIFLALWLWLTLGIRLLAWAAWFGDSLPRWFEWAGPLIAAGLALLYPAWMFFRWMFRGQASRRYLQIHVAVAVALLVLMGALHTYEWASRIYGTTPRAAAEAYLEGSATEDTVYRLVEESNSRKAGAEGVQWVSYRILGPKGIPQGRITVARYSRFWWTFASSESFRPPDEALELAKKLLDDPTGQSTAVHTLREVVSQHPGTAEAAEAERLLEEADSDRQSSTTAE